MDAERSPFYQPFDEINDFFPNHLVINGPGSVPLRRADVDHRIEFDPVSPLEFRIDIDPPEIFLARAVLEESGLFVRVKFSVKDHDLPLYIDDGFDQIAEAVLGHQLEVEAFVHHRVRIGLENEFRRDVDLAVIYANRILLVYNGRLAADGPPQEVLADDERLRSCRVLPTSLLELNRQHFPRTGRFLRAEALAQLV